MYSREEMISYVDSLAKGVDPATGKILNDDTVLNRPDIIRMLYSIKEYMVEFGPKKASKVEFELSTVEGIIESDTSVSNFVKKINDVNCKENMKPLSYRVINAWLIKEGYLEISRDNKKIPTSKGEGIGLYKEIRQSAYGIPYLVVLFNENAQKFILRNLASGRINLDIKSYETSDEE